MATEQQRRDVRQELTDELIKLIESGTAPWQKPWDATAAAAALQLPQNPVTGKPYKGGNSIQLLIAASKMGQGEDPRWCTYKQAQAEGWQVKKGAKAQTIQYWKWDREEKRPNPVTGKSETVTVKLEVPSAFYASVFHASQIDGIPAYEAPTVAREEWETVELAEKIIAQSGARIVHDQLDRAFYSPSTDDIHMPPRAAFSSSLDYYEVLLHEIGHWSGHESRLNRDLSGGFGSASYAREELRAQLASLFISAELGVPFNPERHAAYQGSWISALKDDKNEIYQAASQAHKIAEFVIGLSQSPTQEQAQEAVVNQTPVAEAQVLGYGVPPQKDRVMATQNSEKITYEQTADALSFISPNTERDEWAKIGMAIKSEFPGEDGFSLFDNWSQSGESYKASSADSTWKSIKADGGVTIATLLKEAMDGGWKPDDQTQERMSRPVPIPSPERAEAATKEAALKLAKQEQTAAQAAELWEAGTPDVITPYLDRKGVGSYGLRSMPNGVLLVPLVDEEGKLWNVQRILTQRPENADTDKFYLKDGRKSGLFHLIGEITDERPILFAEGYATGASLHEATGNPVVVTFDSGNLVRVAKLFRGFYSQKPMVICGDDDVQNTHNAGRAKAIEAGAAINAPVVFPTADGFTGKDFNDLHDQYGHETGDKLINALIGQTSPVVEPASASEHEHVATPVEAIAPVDTPLTPEVKQASPKIEPPAVAPDSTDATAAASSDEKAAPELANSVENEEITPVVAPTIGGVALFDTVMARLKEQFLFAEGKFYFRDKKTTLAFIDDGKTFKTEHSSPEVVQAIVALAQAKGWKQLHLNGTPEFLSRAWIEASLIGLKVTGYTPEPVDRAKLQERIAVMVKDCIAVPTVALNQATEANPVRNNEPTPLVAKNQSGEPVMASQIRAELRAKGVTEVAAVETTIASLSSVLKTPRAYVGVLLEHGPAPYKFNKDDKRKNYYAKLKTNKGEEVIWGVDIERAMQENAPPIGETILLAYQGSKPVSVKVDVKDDKGLVLGQEDISTNRNEWLAETIQKLHEDAQVGVVTPKVETQPPATGPSVDEVSKSKGLEIVSRAMAINKVPKNIAASSIAAVADGLQSSNQNMNGQHSVKLQKITPTPAPQRVTPIR